MVRKIGPQNWSAKMVRWSAGPHVRILTLATPPAKLLSHDI